MRNFGQVVAYAQQSIVDPTVQALSQQVWFCFFCLCVIKRSVRDEDAKAR